MTSTEKYNIIIADDHEIVRIGVKHILKSENDFSLEDEASSFTELIEMLTKKRYDLLILDLNLGDKNGIFSLREISDMFADIPILVLSMYPDDPYALQAIHAGASGYLSKKNVSDELMYAIRSILNGETYLNKTYAEILSYGTTLEKTAKSSLESLSKREYEVYTLIISGMRYKDIAEELGLSPKTVSTYRTRILDKMEFSNVHQLIHFSLHNTMI